RCTMRPVTARIVRRTGALLTERAHRRRAGLTRWPSAAEDEDGVGAAGPHRVADADVGVLGAEHVGAVDRGVRPPVEHPRGDVPGGPGLGAGVPDDVLPGARPAAADLRAVVRVVLEDLVRRHPLGPALGGGVEAVVAPE